MNENEFDEMNNSTLNLNLEQLSPGFKDKRYSKQIILQIVDKISDLVYKEERNRGEKIDRAQTFLALKLLFLKGASTQSSPPELSVEIGGHYITKAMIVKATDDVVGNIYIRRVAESIAVEIGQQAEKDELDGELCGSVSKLISEINLKEGYIKHERLTKNERAWCSSFSSAIPDLEKYTTARIKQLLDLDSQTRFAKRKEITTNQQPKNKPKPIRYKKSQ